MPFILSRIIRTFQRYSNTINRRGIEALARVSNNPAKSSVKIDNGPLLAELLMGLAYDRREGDDCIFVNSQKTCNHRIPYTELPDWLKTIAGYCGKLSKSGNQQPYKDALAVTRQIVAAISRQEDFLPTDGFRNIRMPADLQRFLCVPRCE